MKVDLPRYSERLGAVTIKSIQKVYELDSGKRHKPQKETPKTIKEITDDELEDIFTKMAIIIPIKSEKLKLLEGVLSGIPHDCLIIVVSNSSRYPLDAYKLECDTLKQYVDFVDRDAMMIHQKDPGLGEAFKKVDYKSILDGNLVRDGKGEGMIVGMLLAKAVGKEYVGFIDADNYFPGAVNEYVKIFASGIVMSQTPYSMIRISWLYKPKVHEAGLYFAKWGRISEYTNRYLNMLISTYTGFETEIIKTGNSGEHAMSLKLAELLTYSSGFSVEPYEIINILEEFGGILEPHYPEVMQEGVEITQVETRNPHFHEDKGEEHLSEMLKGSLSSIYFSKLCTPELKKQIFDELKSKGIIKDKRQLQHPILIPPFHTIDIHQFADVLQNKCTSLYNSGVKLQGTNIKEVKSK
ncbi:MAG: mannosyl-3-phosphoglycerate synthase [Candidatus Nitrosothermus koennekii]|nr:MAG: mannosyl-3-phosphoglycerate synthase [Candidatus Nitrosothermus koennekii]